MATRWLNKCSIRISLLLISVQPFYVSMIVRAYNGMATSNFLSINDILRIDNSAVQLFCCPVVDFKKKCWYSKLCCNILVPSYFHTQVLQNLRKKTMKKLLIRVTRVVKDTRRIRCGRLLPSGPLWSQYFKLLSSYAFTTFFSIYR